MSHLVSMDWLVEHLNDPEVRVVDCRFVLGQPHAGRESYLAGHLPHALYFDLELDLSAPKSKHGGRHPLPDIRELSDKLGAAGIDANTKVVAYDDQGGAMASRFWWLMQYLGHEQTYVLDGGYTKWQAAGHPVTDEIETPQATTFTPQPQAHLLVGIDELKTKIGQEGVTLIDSREAVRYRGEQEPIDPVAGHIPSAINHFWKDSLTETGEWKSAEEQQARFGDLNSEGELIVYCGSGVTACPNILALRQAGYQNVRLYAGSWSDWISYSENQVATAKGEE